MKNQDDRVRSACVAFWACVQTLQTCKSNKAKALYLLDAIKKTPRLRTFFDKHFEIAVNEKYEQHVKLTMAFGELTAYEEVLELIDNWLVNNAAAVDDALSAEVYLKVIRRYEKEKEEDAGLVCEITSSGDDHHTAVLCYSGKRAANMVWVTGEAMKEAIGQLKELGVVFREVARRG